MFHAVLDTAFPPFFPFSVLASLKKSAVPPLTKVKYHAAPGQGCYPPTDRTHPIRGIEHIPAFCFSACFSPAFLLNPADTHNGHEIPVPAGYSPLSPLTQRRVRHYNSSRAGKSSGKHFCFC